MTPLRSIYRTLLFLALLLAARFDGQIRRLFFGLRPGPAGAVWVHLWCRRFVRALGVGCDVEGPLPVASGPGLAIVSNHLSYLDILCFSAATPFVMVAKSEIKGWPLLGWITAQAGTVYVQRGDCKGDRTQTHAEVNAAMRRAFASGLPVVFFPEGTTTDGTEVLPFRRGLYHSVLANDIPMQTAALAFTFDRPNPGSSIGKHVCFTGDDAFAPHLFRCLGLRGLRASIRFDPRPVRGGNRFVLAANSRNRVVALYGEITPGQPQHAAEPRTPDASTLDAIPQCL